MPDEVVWYCGGGRGALPVRYTSMHCSVAHAPASSILASGLKFPSQKRPVHVRDGGEVERDSGVKGEGKWFRDGLRLAYVVHDFECKKEDTV